MNNDDAKKPIPGMLTLDELGARAEAGDIETVIVAATDHIGRMIGKRFDAEFFAHDIAAHGTHGCDYLLTTDMEMTPVPGFAFANWELGYGDFHLVPDLSTLRVASWLDKTALVLCDIEDADIAPRAILKRQLARASGMGFDVMVASELEYYLFDDGYKNAAQRGYANLQAAGWYLEDYHILQGTREEPFTAAARRHLKRSGVPVENSKGEFGLGQHEVNVRYADALTMADRHIVFKQCLKEIADAQGKSVTFMAKPFAGQAGSSCHIHLSLRRDGANAFAPRDSDATDSFRHFLGGWMAHAREVMPFYAPTINSYKRYEDGSWAPTRIAWSEDNRTAGFRAVGHGQSRRIECRIPGADCNPYLAFAAAIASGLDGIANKIEPPPAFSGNVYQAQSLPRVPYTLRDAADAFASNAFARAAFGEAVVEHYAHYAREEQRQFDSAVTDWERKRYFERI